MLAESLKRAMKQKSFSKITVSEIIQDCGVNRKTFYYHFEDVYDLLEWHLNNEIERAISVESSKSGIQTVISQSSGQSNLEYDNSPSSC